MKTAQLLFTLISLAFLAVTLVSASSASPRKSCLSQSLSQKRRRTLKQVRARNKAAFLAYTTSLKKFRANGERFMSSGNSRTDIVSISSIQSSEHLCSGCQACIKIDGVLKEQIVKGATVRIVVSKFIFTVFDKTYDLCESLKLVPGNEGGGGAGAVQCPIEPKTAEGLRACFPLSETLPTGISAFIKVTGLSADRRQLFSIEGSALIEGNCPPEYGPGSASCLGQ